MLYQGSTHYFVTPLVGREFFVIPDVLIEPFLVYTPMGNSVVAKRVYRKCRVVVPNRVTLAHLVDLDMFDFDIILGINCLHDLFASIDCRTRAVKFQSLMNLF